MTSIETLGRLFGTESKVKIMRLYMSSPATPFDVALVSKKTKVSKNVARKELANLEKAGFLKKKTFHKEQKTKTGISKRKVKGWILDRSFEYITSLQNFLINRNPLHLKDIEDRLKKAGRIKLLVVSGVFIQEEESRVDLLVVGDAIKKPALKTAIRSLEAEVGRELRYTVFSTDDFLYRLGMCDKLVRDILDFPHKKVVSKVEVS